MFSLKNYLPDATLSKYMKVLVKADESVFVKIFLNKQLKTERFIREDEILDAVVELNEGKTTCKLKVKILKAISMF